MCSAFDFYLLEFSFKLGLPTCSSKYPDNKLKFREKEKSRLPWSYFSEVDLVLGMLRWLDDDEIESQVVG